MVPPSRHAAVGLKRSDGPPVPQTSNPRSGKRLSPPFYGGVEVITDVPGRGKTKTCRFWGLYVWKCG